MAIIYKYASIHTYNLHAYVARPCVIYASITCELTRVIMNLKMNIPTNNSIIIIMAIWRFGLMNYIT